MSSVINTITDLWKAHGVWLLVVAIPSILTGLSRFPQAQGFVAKVRKVLDFLSFLTPKDSEGTFKLPLKFSKPPAKMLTDARQPPKDGPGCAASILILIASAAFTLSQASCASWINSDTGKKIRADVIDCGVEAIRTQAAHLLPAIKAIVSTGAVNWKDQVGAFAKEIGRDATACSLHAAAADLEQAGMVPEGEGPGASPEKMRARATAVRGAKRAEVYLDEKNWSIKE